jgi:4-hydroxybenzoate polyprenyltransferase
MAVKNWLALLRLPNLFTVPGDICAGYFLAGAASNPHGTIFSIFLLCMLSLILYCSGLILNDWFDRNIDAHQRPNRPLVSGAIDPKAACIIAIVLIAGAIGGSFFLSRRTTLVVIMLVVLILVYNGWAKRRQPLGFIVMAACRGLNIALGASVILTPDYIDLSIGIAAETIFIFLVTIMAYNENERIPNRFIIWLPVLTTIGFCSFYCGIIHFSVSGVVGSILAGGSIVIVAYSITPSMAVSAFPPKIGAFIRCLIPLQIAFCLWENAVAAGATLLILWAGSYLTSKFIQGS